MFKARILIIMSLLCSVVAQPAAAGVDLNGTITQLQLAPDGKLWFSLSTGGTTYCAAGWGGLNMYVPRNHPDYPYYYGILMLALSSGKHLYIGNISVYNGTTACDITTTGYGLIVLP